MSIRKIVEKYLPTNVDTYNTGDICKNTMKYIKYALSAYGVSMSDFNQIGKKYTGYNVNENLENILKKYIPNNDFPRKREIEQSKETFSSLTPEVIEVVKNFVECNVTYDNYNDLKNRINIQIQEIQEKMETLSDTYKGYANSVQNNMLCYMLADTILKENAQFTFNVDMLYSNNDFDFEYIIDLIHINKQLKDIRRILDRSISIQDCFKMMSM